MARGILRPRAKGSEGAVAARAASVIRGSRPMEHRTGSNRPYVPSVQSDFELACQIQACPVMTGLLAGPLADAAGPGAVRADLAGVVPQLLGPARVSLRISHCDRDCLNRDRRWRGRSQADRGFDRQRRKGRMFSRLGCGTGETRKPPAGSVGRIVVMRIGAVACGDPATGGGW
jgi:hypothetical protein